MTNQPATAAIYGIDIGKTRFDVACLDTTGRPINRLKFRRDTLLKHFSGVAKSVVAMEACPGSQWLARKLQAFGHDVRIIPAQFVKPYVKSNKNDMRDAEAIAEAATRPTMRFVQIKTDEQFDVQALHRARDRLVSTRTRTVSQIRSFCLEYGITMRQGIGVFKLDLPRILSDDANELTPMMRNLLRDLWDEFTQLELRVAKITRQIETLAKMDGVARRLQTIPGIGPLGATALLAAVGNGHQFRRARDLAAWLGLVPRQHSTGGKQVLLGISKRGNSYVRRLLIHGARSAAMHLDKSRDRLGLWIVALRTRMHVNKVIVALANKIARIAWVILNKPGALYERIAPANA
jgi:transposase